MPLQSINPADGALVATYDEADPAQLAQAIAQAHAGWTTWRTVPFAERADRMRAAACLLRERTGRYAQLMTMEMGKPIGEAHAEVDKCAWVCEHYADHAEETLAREVIETDASTSYVTFEPLGVVLAVMPWNFPFWQVFRFAAPALMAGNTGLLKHASNVPGCALAIEEVFRDAGLPQGAFRSLLVRSNRVASIIEDPRVVAVTLTGSTPAGQAVARKAGEMLKKTVLELGGSDPYIILEDADLDEAAEACATSRLINNGQSCIAAKRFIVPQPVRQAFESRLVERMSTRTMGDPMDPTTQLGPLARHDLRDDLHRQVCDSIELGARLLLGGEIPDGPGAYYPATVLTDVGKGMPAYDEELFGPAAAVIPVADEAEAIDAANDSVFGLGAAVFTADAARGEEIAARRLQAGSCFVNTFVRSDPRLPFGGIKQSGYGRELGPYGIKEFVNVKTVYVK